MAAAELPPAGTMMGTRYETLTSDDVLHAAPPCSARAPEAVVALKTHVVTPAVAAVAPVAAARTVVDVALRVSTVHAVPATPAGMT